MTHEYSATQIEILEGLEPVRRRPGMFIGDTGERGMHHLFKEVLDNSIDEAMNGYATVIKVELHDDWRTLTVSDNGRGIPVDKHPEKKISALEVIMTTLHAGGKFDNESYKSGAGGLHGVGVSCVNALSSYLDVSVKRKNEGCFSQRYENGVPMSKVKKDKPSSTVSGTTITFHPSEEFFNKTVLFSSKLIISLMQEAAYLNPGLKLTLKVPDSSEVIEFYSSGGITEHLQQQTSTHDDVLPTEPIVVTGKADDIEVNIALCFAGDDPENIASFVNSIKTSDGGTHVSGFKRALTRTINVCAASHGHVKGKVKFTGDDIRTGLWAIVSVKVRQPQFESQTKTKLSTSDAETAVYSVTTEVLTDYFNRHSHVLKEIVERAMDNYSSRVAAKKAATTVKKKKNTRKPDKLKDCISKNPKECELFLVEGDSAAGSAKDGRNNKLQAILPIRGKIINAEKTDAASILANKEIQSMIAAIGGGINYKNESFDVESIKYDKIIIMTDADVDGSHIAILLLTFFWNFMKPLIEHGKLYFAHPPLYKVTHKGAKQYFWDTSSMNEYMRTHSGSRLTRFKGLGEMNAEELGETTMNPSKRQLIRIKLKSEKEAQDMITILMGKDVKDRKSLIISGSEAK